VKLLVKLAGGVLGAIVVAALAFGLLVTSMALRPARPIGVQQVLAPDSGHASIPVTIWYPTSARPRLVWAGISAANLAPDGAVDGTKLPLIIMSHGTGGSPASHLDTALALAEAGYVVAAPMHPGDNFQDQSRVGTRDWIPDRARQVARAGDYLLTRWSGRSRLDPGRLGVFGFSAGGTTGLIAVGGTPDFAAVAPHCAKTPEFVCRLLKPAASPPNPAAWVHDARLKAAVIVAPGFGFAFAPDGLSQVRAPVQLWQGEADTAVPLATNTAVVRRLLPPGTEFHLVPAAGHVSFVTPCGAARPLMPEVICADPPGFDRKAFHKTFNKAVVGFFDRTLRRR
jgi:predicted dienelactone hydrolase